MDFLRKKRRLRRLYRCISRDGVYSAALARVDAKAGQATCPHEFQRYCRWKWRMILLHSGVRIDELPIYMPGCERIMRGECR